MSATLAHAFIRDLVRDRAAIALHSDQGDLIEGRLRPLLRNQGLESVGELVSVLGADEDPRLVSMVVEALITHETHWFRNEFVFDALAAEVVPELIRSRWRERRLAVWCAACSTGQEPYSLLMTMLEEHPELLSWDLSLLATDVSTTVLERARRGVFEAVEMERGLAGERRRAWFRPAGEDWEISASLRQRVDFRPLNLARPWGHMHRFDLVLLRNVLIYFEEDTRRDILERVHACLAPDGLLVLGSTETTVGSTPCFEPVRIGGALFFRPRPGPSASPRLV